MDREDLARPLRRLQGRIAAHEGDAARVAAEIDGGEIGIGGDNGDIEGIDAENLGHDIGKDRVRSLTDFCRAAKDGDPPTAVAFQLHA